MNIQPFIFNWRGQYKNVCKIESDLKTIFDKVTVINSDDKNKKNKWINIGEESYFARQFLTAIDLFDGDIFFHIQGDITFDQWGPLVESAKQYFEEYHWGIYAPNVDYTWYNAENANINTIEVRKYPHLKVVSNPDCTVWFIHRDIINTLKNIDVDLSFLKHGWGLDLILCANSFLQKRLVLRDYNFLVQHPQGTGYTQEEAFEEMNRLLGMCNPNIQNTIQLIRFQKDYLANYFRS